MYLDLTRWTRARVFGRAYYQSIGLTFTAEEHALFVAHGLTSVRLFEAAERDQFHQLAKQYWQAAHGRNLFANAGALPFLSDIFGSLRYWIKAELSVVITVDHALRGVQIKASSLEELIEAEAQIREQLDRVSELLAVAINYTNEQRETLAPGNEPTDETLPPPATLARPRHGY